MTRITYAGREPPRYSLQAADSTCRSLTLKANTFHKNVEHEKFALYIVVGIAKIVLISPNIPCTTTCTWDFGILGCVRLSRNLQDFTKI